MGGSVRTDRLTECWRWPLPTRRADGRIVVQRQYAYRVLYLMLINPDLPADRDLHHTCENAWCVNPWHCEPMTPSDHGREHTPLPPLPKETCVNGHSYEDPANVGLNRRVRKGVESWERYCRTCRSAWKKARRERRTTTS